MKKLRIADYQDGKDLREINWRKETLNHIAAEWSLEPGQVVVFENKKQEKARLVANINGHIILMIPPIDPQDQLTVHLEVNRFLRTLSSSPQAIDVRHEELQQRLKELKERKARNLARKGAA